MNEKPYTPVLKQKREIGYVSKIPRLSAVGLINARCDNCTWFIPAEYGSRRCQKFDFCVAPNARCNQHEPAPRTFDRALRQTVQGLCEKCNTRTWWTVSAIGRQAYWCGCP